MRVFKYLVVPIILTGIFCVEESPPQPNIYAVLSSDSAYVMVLVGELIVVGDTFPVDTVGMDTVWSVDTFFLWPNTMPLWNGVSGAEVVLQKGSQGFILEEIQDSAGYYVGESISFSPGEEWELLVTYPEDREVAANVRIPDTFRIISPANDTLSIYDSLCWTKSAGAKGYELHYLWWLTYQDEDTTFSRFGKWFWGRFPPDNFPDFPGHYFSEMDSVEILISALDTNLYDYLTCYNPYSDINAYVSNPEDYMHIEGAWGVFGAQTVVSRRYYLPLPDTTYPPAVDKE